MPLFFLGGGALPRPAVSSWHSSVVFDPRAWDANRKSDKPGQSEPHEFLLCWSGATFLSGQNSLLSSVNLQEKSVILRHFLRPGVQKKVKVPLEKHLKTGGSKLLARIVLKVLDGGLLFSFYDRILSNILAVGATFILYGLEIIFFYYYSP